MKTVGRSASADAGGRVDWVLTFAAAAYNLVRIRNLEAARA